MEEEKPVFVKVKDIPVLIRRTGRDYETLFNTIPKDEAMVIEPKKAKLGSIRIALKSLHNKGKYLNISVTQRKEKVYILNTEPKEKPKKAKET
jgi:ribosomal protein L36